MKVNEKGFVDIEIKNLVDWHGGNGDGCFVTNRISKEGWKVGYMYREEPDENYPDSGWRFTAGNEDDAYMENSDNMNIFKINTVCNFDPDIIKYLDSPVGTHLIRVGDHEFEIDNGSKPIKLVMQDEVNKKATPQYLYSENEIKKFEKYIEKEYGGVENVIHEIVSPDVHLDIAIVPPSENQPYYKLITMGAGAYKMSVPKELKKHKLERAEYVIFLPSDWNIESSRDEDYWPIRELKETARLPLTTDSWLAFGHTVSGQEEKPYAANTKFNSLLLLNSLGKQNQIVRPLKLGFAKTVNFYQLYPLYQEELDFKLEHSLEELMEKIPDDDLDFIVNIKRKNYGV